MERERECNENYYLRLIDYAIRTFNTLLLE